MIKDRKIVYLLSILIFLLLSFALFLPIQNLKLLVAFITLIFALLSSFLIKKRNILSIYKRQIILIMFVISLVYLMLYYMSGIAFGFLSSVYPLSISTFLRFILPIGTIIVSIEIIRNIFVAQNNRIANIFIFLSGIVIDLLLVGSLNDIKSFSNFMDFFGLAFIPAITGNMLYQYIAKRYGIYPNIVFRLIMVLYAYIIPYEPATPDLLVSFVKLLVPLIVYFYIDSLYEKKQKKALKRTSKFSYVCLGALSIVVISIVMIISGQFRYGMIVIGSESMSGEFEKGDIILYEKYDDQVIVEGQIIVFEKDDINIIHRVIEIEYIDGETRYYTKGDANEDMDEGFIFDSQIIGLTNYKISYLGYPTLWIHEIFK